jgi:hypothetical protein
MVFGLFEGSMELKLNKMAFAFGETIEGTASLKLSKEKKARRVVVTVFAERKTTNYSNKGASTDLERIFSFETVLDGEKNYLPPGADYPFKIQLPAQNPLPKLPQFNGLLGQLATYANEMAQGSVSWYVEAKLDVPMAFDISKKIQIMVR